MDALRWLVVCDIDGTLFLPDRNNPGLEEFNRFVDARRDHIVFAVNSGRGLAEIASVAENGPIARPDWLLSDVGTMMYSGFSDGLMDEGWNAIMTKDWGRASVRAALASCPGIEEQEEAHQHPAKLSYYIKTPTPSIESEILSRIAPWISACKCVVSFDYYVDIMPSWGGKGAPVEYLAKKLGISRERIVVAGDSGNDRDMLDRGLKSVIVSNHSAVLDDLAGKDGVYFAQTPVALGMLEGFAHFGLE